MKLGRSPEASARNTGGRRDIERGIWSRTAAAGTEGAGLTGVPDAT